MRFARLPHVFSSNADALLASRAVSVRAVTYDRVSVGNAGNAGQTTCYGAGANGPSTWVMAAVRLSCAAWEAFRRCKRASYVQVSAIPTIAALVVSMSGSFAAAQGTWNVLTQYQYAISTGTSDSTLTTASDWFSGVNAYYRTGTVGTAPTGLGAVYTGSSSSLSAADFSGSSYSDIATVGSLWNYTSKAPITNSTNLFTGTPMATGTGPITSSRPASLTNNLYVAGPGMNYIAQNAGVSFAAQNGSNFRLRNGSAGDVNLTGASNIAPANTSTGITFLGYAGATPTTLSSGTYVYALALSTNGADPARYDQSFRAAIQDTTGQWWLSAWNSGTYAGTPSLPYTLDMNTGAYFNGYSGTSTGPAFGVTGTAQGWYQYTPATLASSGLALLDTSTATYSQYFTGTAQAFGVYFGQAASNIGFRVRGFEVLHSPVAVPEPSTYAMALAGLACGGYSLFRRRKWA
jgi:hypothetical protein